MLQKIKSLLFGSILDPFDPRARHSLALIALLAWVGIGADGLSSSVYGPEEAFKALGDYYQLGPILALATGITVFIISLSYNQVIELFPSGGGGYKVATTLLGPYPGLVSGTALLVDYVLTITISVTACTDAIWSVLPESWQVWQVYAASLLILFLMILNLRGVKEPITLLAPIFFGFLLTHLVLIVYGIAVHSEQLPNLMPDAVDAFSRMEGEMGLLAAIAFILKAYSLSAGTYTGIEAVSNNVHILAEPRIRTGKLTMLYMAISLALAAAGVTMIYQLWTPGNISENMTLNASAFQAILFHMTENADWTQFWLAIVLGFEALLLIIAANAGFLGGPSVLANMALDRWAPHSFSYLSNRLVTQNGIICMAAAAIAVLWLTGADISLLVVLYSVNVFITFTLTLLGLVRFWLKNPDFHPRSKQKLLLSAAGFFVCSSILVVMVIEKFQEGAWATIIVTGTLIVIFMAIRYHYQTVSHRWKKSDLLLDNNLEQTEINLPSLPEPGRRVAVILVGRSLGAGVNELLTVTRLFPNVFEGFIFVSVGEVDIETFSAQSHLEALRESVRGRLSTLAQYCWSRKLKADFRDDYGVDVVGRLQKICEDLWDDYPDMVVFSTQLVFENDSLILRLLHNQTSTSLQRKLHLRGIPMMVLSVKL